MNVEKCIFSARKSESFLNYYIRAINKGINNITANNYLENNHYEENQSSCSPAPLCGRLADSVLRSMGGVSCGIFIVYCSKKTLHKYPS